jgi:hypothetical protein
MTRAQLIAAVVGVVAVGTVVGVVVTEPGDDRVIDVALEADLRRDLGAIRNRAVVVAGYHVAGSPKNAAALAIAGRADIAVGRLDAATLVMQPPPPTPTDTTPTDPPPVFVADRYVSPSGDDTSPGTIDRPWRTIQKAVATATAGQVVALRGGTYSGTVTVSRAGTQAAPITIAEYPGEAAVFSEGGTPFNVAGSAAWWVFQDFTIRGATGASTTNVYGQGSSHDIVFDGVEIRDSERQGVFLDRRTARYTFQDCLVADNGGSGPVQQDHGLYLEGTGHVVRGCTVRDQANGYGIQVYPFARDTLIQGNVVEAVPFRAGIIIGSDVQGTVVEGNTFRAPMGGVGGVSPARAVGSCCGLPSVGGNVVRGNTADFPAAFQGQPGLSYSGNQSP